MIRWTGRLPRFSQTFVEERHDRSSREWRWSWRAVRRTWTNIDVDIWRVRRRHGAASTSHGRRIGNAISATVWNPITFFSVFVYYAHGRVIFHGETANLWRGEGPRRYGRTTKRGGGWDASSRQYPVCALVRIPGYQVSFKNCPKEFDIREMAARRACHGPALYTRAFVEAALLWGAPIIRNLDGCISYSAKETLRFQFLFADSNVLSLPTMQAKGLNI